jgi:hypothetical protein
MNGIGRTHRKISVPSWLCVRYRGQGSDVGGRRSGVGGRGTEVGGAQNCGMIGMIGDDWDGWRLEVGGWRAQNWGMIRMIGWRIGMGIGLTINYAATKIDSSNTNGTKQRTQRTA